MRTIMIGIALTLYASTLQGQTLTASQAKSHEGENATVCGVVASERTATSSRGEPTFINLDAAYPKQVFTVLVWGDDRKNVGELPDVGSHLCVKGQITDYHGVPEIVVKSSGQLSKQQ
jgi:hypothetical protein